MRQRPSGSMLRLPPSSEAGTIVAPLDSVGRYVFELLVTDSAGCTSTATAIVNVIGEEGIHIELDWFGDAILYRRANLHFLDATGVWLEPGKDIYWCHPTADWGEPGIENDPVLVFNDRQTGPPPEVLSYVNPVPGEYRVGVYGSRLGGSLGVGIRVFVDGELVLAEDANVTEDARFWHVLDLEWPGRSMEVRDEFHEEFPLGGDL